MGSCWVCVPKCGRICRWFRVCPHPFLRFFFFVSPPFSYCSSGWPAGLFYFSLPMSCQANVVDQSAVPRLSFLLLFFSPPFARVGCHFLSLSLPHFLFPPFSFYFSILPFFLVFFFFAFFLCVSLSLSHSHVLSHVFCCVFFMHIKHTPFHGNTDGRS